MAKRSINVSGMFAVFELSNREKKLLTPQTFLATVRLDKSEYCEKCLGSMKKDAEVGWIPATRGPIAGWDVHKYTCEECSNKHEMRNSRD